MTDEIIVFGCTREELDCTLNECLSRLAAKNLTLNPKKCQSLQQSLNFFGQMFSTEGITPDPQQNSALENSKTLTSAIRGTKHPKYGEL